MDRASQPDNSPTGRPAELRYVGTVRSVPGGAPAGDKEAPGEIELPARQSREARLAASPNQSPWSGFRFYHLEDSSLLAMDRLP